MKLRTRLGLGIVSITIILLVPLILALRSLEEMPGAHRHDDGVGRVVSVHVAEGLDARLVDRVSGSVPVSAAAGALETTR